MAHPDYVARLQDGASSGRPSTPRPSSFSSRHPGPTVPHRWCCRPRSCSRNWPACPDRTRAQFPDTAGRRPKWAARSSGFMGQVAGQSVSVRCDVSQLLGSHEDLDGAYQAGSVRAYLDGVGLPSRAPPIAPSRLDRQLEFDEPACSLRRVSADTPVPTRHAIAATRRFSMSSA